MRNTKKGFTLVELLVVIAILAILATVSVVGYTSYISRTEQTAAETEAASINDAIVTALVLENPSYIQLADGTYAVFTRSGNSYTVSTSSATPTNAEPITNIPADLVDGLSVEENDVLVYTSDKGVSIDVVKGELYTGEVTPPAGGGDDEPAHTHNYTSSVTAPTCTEDGYTTYTCGCGDTYTGDVVAAAHSYATEWSSDSAQHWHECTCSDKKDTANHDWQDGFCTICDKEVTWTLVTDSSQLAAGNQIVIVAANTNVALSKTQNTNNRAGTTVTKNNDGTITMNDNVQVLVLHYGLADGTFAFYTGTGYLYAASTADDSRLRVNTDLTAACGWNIVVNNGVASVVANNEGITRKVLKYNPNTANNSPLFNCYASGQQDISIYVSAEKVEVPDKPEIPEVPDEVLSATINTYANVGVKNGTETISWTNEGFTVTVAKNGSSTAIRTTDADHFRCYTKNKITVAGDNNEDIYQIVFTCDSASYAEVLKDSLGTIANATVTKDGAIVTVIFNSAVKTFTTGNMTAQMRLLSISVEYMQ